MENYKEKYEQLIKRIKHFHETVSPDWKRIIESHVPELKESEDERIKKEIISHLISFNNGYYKKPSEDVIDSWIAWIGKQGKVKHTCGNCKIFQNMHQNCPYSPIHQYTDLKEAHKHLDDETRCEFWLEKQGEQSIYDVPSRNIILAVWELGNEWKELTNGCITEHGTQLEYIQKHWNESEYYLRDKQGEQKPTDKAEPKFKVGDWVTDDGRIMFQILKIENEYYITDDGDKVFIKLIDKHYHLWTIQDAKDGDVLASEGVIGIFESLGSHPDGGTNNDNSYCNLYCRFDDFFYADFESGNIMDSSYNIHPANKEQRDTLMKAITDAGYAFDFEKKELKKIS